MALLLATSRLKRFLELCLLVVGLGGLIVVGGKAIAGISDRRFVDGVRQQPLDSPTAPFVNRVTSTSFMATSLSAVRDNTSQKPKPKESSNAKSVVEKTAPEKVEKKQLKGLDIESLID
jgi:hypothetical protein